MCRLTSRAISGRVVVSFVILLSLSLTGTAALGRDADGAKKDIDAAKKDIADNAFDKAATDLQLADAELDGISDAAAKADLTTQIGALKKQIADTTANASNADLIQKLDFHVKSLKDYLDDHDGFQADLKETQDLLATDSTKTALGDAKIADYQKQIGVLVKVEKQKHVVKAHSDIEAQLKSGEDRLVEFKKVLADPNGSTFDKGTDVQMIQGVVKQVGFLMQDLPADDSAIAGYTARSKALDDSVNSVLSAGAAADVLDHLTQYWDGYKSQYEGWEAETTGPTFDQYTKQSSDAMSKFNAPKTAELATVSDQWLSSAKESTKDTANDPKIMALIASVKQQHDAAVAKLAKFADSILTEAEKLPSLNQTQSQKMEEMASADLRLALPGYDGAEALKARATALAAKFAKGQADATAAAEGANKQLTDAATAAWPDMAAKFTTEDGFDPTKVDAFKGKTIRFKNVNNRMGWDYTGDFDFAISINGMPVAGKFAPDVAAAVTDVTRKTKQDLDDHHWDVIAVVEGTGQLKEQTSADVKSDGTTIGKIEGSRPVDCAVLKIVALHVGPVAVAQGQGAVDETGKVAGTAGGAETAGAGGGVVAGTFHLMERLIACAIGLAGAGLAYMKAKPAAAAQAMGAQGAASVATVNKNLDVFGLIVAVLGVLWLLHGLIYRDLLPASALIACGLYAASDLLKSKGMLPAATAEKIKPLGLQLAILTAVLMAIHLIAGQLPLI